MRTLTLTHGFVETVDDEDYDMLIKKKWRTSFENGGRNLYAIHGYRDGRKVVKIRMHRYILGLQRCSDVVDHVDGNGLNSAVGYRTH